MAKGKMFTMLVVSTMMGAGALFGANSWLNSQSAPDDAAIEMTGIVVTTQDIPMGTLIDTKHLRLRHVPDQMVPNNSYMSIDDVVGKVAKQDLFSDEVLRPERIAIQGEGSSLAAIIGPNMRAVTIRVNDVIGVAGFLLPGNRVDVISSVKTSNRQVSTKTIIKDVKVLAVDQTARNNDNKPVIVRAVTLEVDAKQAEKLMTASTRGVIQLALRNPFEQEEVVKAKPIKRYKKTVVSRPKSSVASVTVIKGTDTSRVKVKQ